MRKITVFNFVGSRKMWVWSEIATYNKEGIPLTKKNKSMSLSMLELEEMTGSVIVDENSLIETMNR